MSHTGNDRLMRAQTMCEKCKTHPATIGFECEACVQKASDKIVYRDQIAPFVPLLRRQ
jgi:hypothetical protein